ncbi:hypothetical protein Taro_043996 [Colocasia esculenta]|uniref:Uncharacterized protein n=1 Tax=Colocasia esculenta TaxID=4460 RepID=A0A843X4U6_COLES|nr:hypothetical protein [Colocasia esculenta]
MSARPRRWQHLRPILLFASISPLLIPGAAHDPSRSKAGTGTASHSSSSGGDNALDAFYICLGLVAFLLIAIFLYKLWQRKRRQEQQARLLSLFEEDDELELELGLRS